MTSDGAACCWQLGSDKQREFESLNDATCWRLVACVDEEKVVSLERMRRTKLQHELSCTRPLWVDEGKVGVVGLAKLLPKLLETLWMLETSWPVPTSIYHVPVLLLSHRKNVKPKSRFLMTFPTSSASVWFEMLVEVVCCSALEPDAFLKLSRRSLLISLNWSRRIQKQSHSRFVLLSFRGFGFKFFVMLARCTSLTSRRNIKKMRKMWKKMKNWQKKKEEKNFLLSRHNFFIAFCAFYSRNENVFIGVQCINE